MFKRCLHGNRGFQFPFWSMIYLPLELKVNTIVILRNIIVISIASTSWTRLERGYFHFTKLRNDSEKGDKKDTVVCSRKILI